MSAVRLDHFNLSVKTADAANEYVRFFTAALGLQVGPRPPFNFEGFWLYAGDAAIVHISILPSAPGGRPNPDIAGTPEDTGVIDHVAFWADNYEELSAHLKRGGGRIGKECCPDGRCTRFL